MTRHRETLRDAGMMIVALAITAVYIPFGIARSIWYALTEGER